MAEPPDLPGNYRHGMASSYNIGCRCDPCTAAASAARAAWARSLQDRPFSDVPHGSNSGYRNWACRCDSCKVAGAAVARARRQQLRDREQAAE